MNTPRAGQAATSARGSAPLRGKAAIVTGGASGLGRATAPAEAGADVVVADLDGAGGCWFIQAGGAPEPFRFRNVPAPGRAA
ncbi:hypothetical protein [Streptomyces sp. NPDC002994]|uniref:hypothetical protein n=1 Tax=Streptomyces sp. NPDC002994 TaxID=3154441 RepID=UPI0033B5FC00